MVQVVFLQSFEQYEEGKGYTLERTLANGLCKRNICVPFTVHQKMLKEAEQKVIESESKEAAKKEKAEEEKKAALLREKAEEETEKADSKKTKRSEKSVKK